MGSVVCVEAPRLFSMLWTAVKPFMSQKTKRKINFIRGPELRRELAHVLFGQSPGAMWFTMHMERNRKKGEVRSRDSSRPVYSSMCPSVAEEIRRDAQRRP